MASESDAATEVAVGRADAAIFSEFSTGSLLAQNKNLRTLGGPPLFVDANSYLMPLGDEKAHHWISNWMRYQSAHQTMASRLEEVGRPSVGEVPPGHVGRRDERRAGSDHDLIRTGERRAQRRLLRPPRSRRRLPC